MATVEKSRIAGIPFRNLYIYLALLIPALVFGFWKTYFGILDNLPDTVTLLIHVHSALMILWLFMLIAQSWFYRTKRFRLHRWLGRSSFVIVPVILCSGLAAVHASLNRPAEGLTHA